MEYSVGDKVRVRSWESMAEEFIERDLPYADSYIDIGEGFVKEMNQYSGEIVTIVNIDGNKIFIKEDYQQFSWNEGMFEPVELIDIKDFPNLINRLPIDDEVTDSLILIRYLISDIEEGVLSQREIIDRLKEIDRVVNKISK